MPRSTLRILHAATSALGFALVCTFFVSALAAEAAGGPGAVLRVRTGIFYTLFVLVPVLAAAAASGRRLAAGSRAPVVLRKARRMRLAGANAALVLVPCAVALYRMAGDGSAGGAFAAVQAVELLAGAANVALLGLNLRDGLRMRAARGRSGRGAPRRPEGAPAAGAR